LRVIYIRNIACVLLNQNISKIENKIDKYELRCWCGKVKWEVNVSVLSAYLFFGTEKEEGRNR